MSKFDDAVDSSPYVKGSGGAMTVTCWGCRGSIPTPGPDTVRYGGNTTCYVIEADSGELLVLDAGSGIRPFGLELMKSGPRDGALLITHTHHDHIIGFPFFVPFYVPGNKWRVAGPTHLGRELGEIIEKSMSNEYFPVRSAELDADLSFETWKPGEYEVGPFKVTTRYMNHSVTCLGYRVEFQGKVVVFTGDHEPYYDLVWHDKFPSNELEEIELKQRAARVKRQNDEVREFFEGADLLIYDAMYTRDEYAEKRGWGHTWIEYAIEDAKASGVSELWLSHHDPTRADDAIDALGETLPALVDGAELTVSFAREGGVWRSHG